MKFIYWAVDCKTEKCDTTIALAVIGPASQGPVQRVYMLMECSDFKETCSVCQIEHTYSQVDVRQISSDSPPPDFSPSPAFLEATTPKKQ